MLVVSVLLGRSATQHLHGFAGDPVVLEKKLAKVVNPLPGQHQSLVQQPAVVVLSSQLHELSAATQRSVQQHLHFQWCSPDVHRTVNHEGTVRHEQHRSSFKGGMQHKVQQQLNTALHSLTGGEFLVSTGLHVHPAQNRPPEACVD